MSSNDKKTESTSAVRKISSRRLKDLRKESLRIERRLSTLQNRSNEVKTQVESVSSNGVGKTTFVMEVEYIDSEVRSLNAALARIAKTHSDFLTKNQKLDQERLGLE